MRELRNIVIRLTARHAGKEVSADQLRAEFDYLDIPEPAADPNGLAADNPENVRQAARQHLEKATRINLDTTLELWQRCYIDTAIELSNGNMSQAARRLGINRTTLYNRLEGRNRQ